MSASTHNELATRRMARLAGFAYVMYTLAGLYITFGPMPSLSVLSEDGTGSEALEFLFRTGFLAETILYTFVVVSAAAMYAVLKSVNQGLALVAAFCRLVEGAMGATFIIFKYAAFAAVVNPDVSAGLSGEAQSAVVRLLQDVYGSALYVLLIPMAVGGVLFFTLFFRSRFIPRWLSGWGIFTYSVIGTLAGAILLYPDLRDHVMLFFLPGALFEWVAAVWLLVAGINVGRWRERLSPAS